jgi:hypothetical protein
MSDDFHPRLIQRLEKPWEEKASKWDIHTPTLGFSPEFLKMIDEVMCFDYMGSAEFEWGALPKAFRAYAEELEKGNITTQTLSLECLKPDYIWPPEIEDKIPDSKFADIYIIAPKKLMDKVIYFVETLGIEEPRLKELSKFRNAVFAEDVLKHTDHASGKRTVGWFDIKNLFFFFRDKEMFDNMKIISGLERPPAPHSKPRDASAGPT